MEYYAPEKEERIKRKLLRRTRLKVKPINASQLDRNDLAELGLLTDDGEVIGNSINDEKLNELIEHTRYMNSHVVKGYKFAGVVPEPKDVSYYKSVCW